MASKGHHYRQTVRRPELWLVNELILRRASAMGDRGLRVGKSEPAHAGWWVAQTTHLPTRRRSSLNYAPASRRSQMPRKRDCLKTRFCFLLSPRGTSGERIEERGIPNKNAPPLPAPLLHFVEEREKDGLPDKF